MLERWGYTTSSSTIASTASPYQSNQPFLGVLTMYSLELELINFPHRFPSNDGYVTMNKLVKDGLAKGQYIPYSGGKCFYRINIPTVPSTILSAQMRRTRK